MESSPSVLSVSVQMNKRSERKKAVLIHHEFSINVQPNRIVLKKEDRLLSI